MSKISILYSNIYEYYYATNFFFLRPVAATPTVANVAVESTSAFLLLSMSLGAIVWLFLPRKRLPRRAIAPLG